MKRRNLTIIACTLVATMLTGCGASNATRQETTEYSSHNIETETEELSESQNTSEETTNGQEANIQTDNDVSVVYMTTDISSDGLMAAYEALGVTATGENVAVKLSTGENGSNYLAPDLIKDLVQTVNGTIVECNTAYGGNRSNTAMHKQLAVDHGFTAIADMDIMDEEGSMTIPIEGGVHLSEDTVGSHFADYDFYVVLSHFKGHAMAGFGGAIKNISIGIASSQGKSLIHTAGNSPSSMWGGDQDDFLESMADAGKGVSDYLDGILLSALFQRYVPSDTFSSLFGEEEGFGVLMAATIGVPLYVCGGGTIPLLMDWMMNGMSLSSASAFMIMGPATKITNLGALKIVLGMKKFVAYIIYVMTFSLLTGLIVNWVLNK